MVGSSEKFKDKSFCWFSRAFRRVQSRISLRECELSRKCNAHSCFCFAKPGHGRDRQILHSADLPFANRKEETSDNLPVGSFKPWRIGGVDGRVRSHLVERFWGPSELTIREWIGSINTSAFVGLSVEPDRHGMAMLPVEE